MCMNRLLVLLPCVLTLLTACTGSGAIVPDVLEYDDGAIKNIQARATGGGAPFDGVVGYGISYSL